MGPDGDGFRDGAKQGYALDFVGSDVQGRSAALLGDAKNLDDYAIFGHTIYSPCSGIVSVAVDQYDDLIPPETDPDQLAGNHVLIECEGVEVLLAHMKRRSVRVGVGDTVSTQTILGQVGNTGNTSEPHLHIHAETGGEPGGVLDGRSVPITIDGRFLVRGNVIRTDP